MAEIGIAIGGSLGELAAVARRCERAGFATIWVAETARTAYVQAAAALAGTERVRVGTSIALAFPRSPVITAMTARDLAELGGGRFVLGLGTQVKRVNELRYATPFEHPAPKIAEVIDVCRAVWRAFDGEPMDHRGRFYTVTMPPFPGGGPAPGPIPIFLAGVNRRMVELAGQKCEGFLGHPFTSVRYLTEKVRPALAAGAARAGRDAADVEIVQSVITAVAGDRREAIEAAKIQIAFYATTRTYRPVLDLHGFGNIVDPLRAAYAGGDLEGMRALITDEMVETYAVAGTPEDVRAGIGRYEGLCDQIVLNTPWSGPDLVRSADVFDRLIATFGAD